MSQYRASFCLLQWGVNETLLESCQTFEVAAVLTSGLDNLVFSPRTGFSSASNRLLIKPMVTTEPTVGSARLLGLGLIIYPSRVHAESFPGTPKSSKRKKRSVSRGGGSNVVFSKIDITMTKITNNFKISWSRCIELRVLQTSKGFWVFLFRQSFEWGQG